MSQSQNINVCSEVRTGESRGLRGLALPPFQHVYEAEVSVGRKENNERARASAHAWNLDAESQTKGDPGVAVNLPKYGFQNNWNQRSIFYSAYILYIMTGATAMSRSMKRLLNHWTLILNVERWALIEFSLHQRYRNFDLGYCWQLSA